MEPTWFTIVCLPKLQDYKGPDARKLAEKFRELRLVALKTSPNAFASSYEAEVNADLKQTLDRLSNHQAHQFIAIQGDFTSHNASTTDLLAAKWIGMIVLIGPAPTQISAKSDPLHQIEHDSKSGRYHLNGVFVRSGSRRGGVGRALIAAALEKGRADSESDGERFHCTIMVDSENGAAEELYRSLGFSPIGSETYQQQTKSPSSHVAERVAIVLEVGPK